MIISMKPLPLAEAKTLAGDLEEKKVLDEYFKKFTKITEEQVQELYKELKALDNVKLKEDYIVKIADFLPRDAEEVHKIFHDVSLDEQELNSILDIVKKY